MLMIVSAGWGGGGTGAFPPAPGGVNKKPQGPDLESIAADFEAIVAAEAVGAATSGEMSRLEANPEAWAATLRRLITETDGALRQANRMSGPEREQVLADFRQEREHLRSSLAAGR